MQRRAHLRMLVDVPGAPCAAVDLLQQHDVRILLLDCREVIVERSMHAISTFGTDTAVPPS